jgi:general secretion pathway protein D
MLNSILLTQRKLRRLSKLLIAVMILSGALGLHAQSPFAQPSSSSSRSSSSGETRQYHSNTMLGDALVSIDPETRSLIITTDEETNKEISKVIKNLDRPKPQVLIKVLFLEVTYNKNFDFGIEGTFNLGNNGKGTVQTAFGLAQEVTGGFWRVMVDDLQVTLRALASDGKLEVLSRPSILARNNQEAVIDVGQEIPIITNSQITDTGQTINTVQYQDVGIILKVTPFITSDDLVEMIVAPEISTLSDQTIPISSTVNSPVINKRSAETVVLTPNNKTVIIGGLMDNKKTESIQKIPILGDIPLLGNLFRRTVKSSDKTELLIFLTPSVIKDPATLLELSKKEVQAAKVTTKNFTEEDLERNLDGLNPVRINPELEEKIPEEEKEKTKEADPDSVLQKLR